MSHYAHAESRSNFAVEKTTPCGVSHTTRTLLLTLADLDHQHQSKLERLRLSRMPTIWQDEIAETLRRAYEATRAAYAQRLRELDHRVPARNPPS